MRKPYSVLLLAAVTLTAGCKKQQTVLQPMDGGTNAAAVGPGPAPTPTATVDAGEALTVEQVDRYLEYRAALTATHRALAPKLDAVEAKSRKKDGGGAAEEGLKLMAEESKAKDDAQQKSGLSQQALDDIEAMVQEMFTEREMAADTANPQDLAEMEAVAKKLPADQKTALDESIAALKAQRERSENLTDLRAHYGDATVEVLLKRDKQLLDAWREWTTVLAGEAD